MKNVKKLFFIGIATFSIISSISPINHAQAASWHKGTPKVMHGKWRVKHIPTSMERLQITKNRVYFYSVGKFYLKNIKYKKLNHNTYKVSGTEYTYLHSVTSVKIKVKSHKVIQYKGNYPGANWETFVRR